MGQVVADGFWVLQAGKGKMVQKSLRQKFPVVSQHVNELRWPRCQENFSLSRDCRLWAFESVCALKFEML